MTDKEKQLAAMMLNLAADEFGNHGCNDWEWPDDWTIEERRDFVRRYEDWNSKGRDFDPDHLALPDYAVMDFLAALLRG